MPQSFSRYVVSPLPKPLGLGVRRHLLDRLLRRQPLVRPRIDETPVFGVRLVHSVRPQRRPIQRLNHDLYREMIFFCKLEIALVVRRNRHHCARSIFREDEIRHPDGHALARKRIHGESPSEESFLLGRRDVGSLHALALHRLELRFHRGAPADAVEQLFDIRMPRRDHHRRDSVNRVDARRENFEA